MNVITKLISLGGNHWSKGIHNRIYFNVTPDDIDLRIHYYNTGNISSSCLGDKRISNTKGGTYLNQLKTFIVYVDLNDCTLHHSEVPEIVTEYWNELKSKIFAIIS